MGANSSPDATEAIGRGVMVLVCPGPAPASWNLVIFDCGESGLSEVINNPPTNNRAMITNIATNEYHGRPLQKALFVGVRVSLWRLI